MLNDTILLLLVSPNCDAKKVGGWLTWVFLCLLGAGSDFFVNGVGCCCESCFFVGGRWPGKIDFVGHCTDSVCSESQCEAEMVRFKIPLDSRKPLGYVFMLVLSKGYKAQLGSVFENSWTISCTVRLQSD